MKLALLKPEPSIRQLFPRRGGISRTLGIGDNGITSFSTFTKIVGLEISTLLIESNSMKKIVVHVASIEQLGNDKVDIFLWCQSKRLLVIVHEDHGLVDRSVIVDVV